MTYQNVSTNQPEGATVLAIPTGADYMAEGIEVGLALDLEDAKALVKDAGFRLMDDDEGGCCELRCGFDYDEFYITVYDDE